MTRKEMIKKLIEIKDEIAINRESELTEFARKTLIVHLSKQL